MRLEARNMPHKRLLLIAETKAESNMIDDALGDCGGDHLGVSGTIQLSDGMREHYIELRRDTRMDR